MMRSNSRARPRAFTITEILVVIGLLGIITLAGGRLFVAGIKTANSAAQAQNRTASFDSAINLLRRDVWSAKEIHASGNRAEIMSVPAQAAIVWTSRSGALIRHVNGERDQSWPIGADISFASDNPQLRLAIAANHDAAAAELNLVSELQLLRRVQ